VIQLGWQWPVVEVPRERVTPPQRPRLRGTPQLPLPLPPTRDLWRRLPLVRGLCPESRPCPYVSCRNHLLVDSVRSVKTKVHELASSVLTGNGADWTTEQIWEALDMLPETCALDVAERGGATQDEVAKLLGCGGRTRVEAIESEARQAFASGMADLIGDEGLNDYREHDY